MSGVVESQTSQGELQIQMVSQQITVGPVRPARPVAACPEVANMMVVGQVAVGPKLAERAKGAGLKSVHGRQLHRCRH